MKSNLKTVLLTGVLFCVGCAAGSRVAMGPAYAPVPTDHVEILLEEPPSGYKRIGLVFSQGAAVANDATTIQELRAQAAKLGADAVVITNQAPHPYGLGYVGPHADGVALKKL